MDILVISNEDLCRSRMAQELLNSFGRGMKITTAGIAEGSHVPEVVCRVMERNGYEVSRKKPVLVSACTHQNWDFVITLCTEAEDELKYLNLQTGNVAHLHFEDALQDSHLDEGELEQRLEHLYKQMYHDLFEFYRDILSEQLRPHCTCGANDYCRCE